MGSGVELSEAEYADLIERLNMMKALFEALSKPLTNDGAVKKAQMVIGVGTLPPGA
jgi:hypothetical protein